MHGSAPDIAGKGVANPLACVLSFAMMLRYSFGQGAYAYLLEQAIEKVLADGVRTADLMQDQGGSPVTTSQMGDAILGAQRPELSKAAPDGQHSPGKRS